MLTVLLLLLLLFSPQERHTHTPSNEGVGGFEGRMGRHMQTFLTDSHARWLWPLGGTNSKLSQQS